MAKTSDATRTLKGRARIPSATLAAWRSSRAAFVTRIAVEILEPLIRLLARRVDKGLHAPPEA